MRKWNNAEIVSIELNATANGSEYWDQEATKYQKARNWDEEDVRISVGPTTGVVEPGTTSVVADLHS
ncbi:hypothetical protein [Butyrivibrio sp. VCB2006]|uniref:hypothetical protein n=1 Tax=Butyrivibrio sp. VCB2006 TaxID=1280679 RepID=UPI0004290915|nr:hypothetical protein [Butyrivibrio sp. VCB2006]